MKNYFYIKNMYEDNTFDKKLLLGIIKNSSLPLIPVHYCGGIIRARKNETNERFCNLREISYPLPEFAKLNRFSLERQPMFYGSIFSSSLDENNCLPRIINILELCNFDDEAYQRTITIGRWDTFDYLNLLVFPIAEYQRSFSEMEEIKEAYEEIKQEYSKEDCATAEYIGGLVSQDKNTCLYDMTATIAWYILYSSPQYSMFDGFLYPSIKVAGEGINICIKPEAVDSKLYFRGARKMMIEKVSEKEISVNDIEDAIRGNGNKLIWGPLRWL